jgi:hypothetical protein
MEIGKVVMDVKRRALMLHMLVNTMPGRLDTIELLYSAGEGVRPSVAIARHLWLDTLPEVEPAAMAPGELSSIWLAEGTLGEQPHAWFLVRGIGDEQAETAQIIIDPNLPECRPTIILVNPSSPLFYFYKQENLYGPGEAGD